MAVLPAPLPHGLAVPIANAVEFFYEGGQRGFEFCNARALPMPVSVSIEFPEDNDIDIDPYYVEMGQGYVSVKGRHNRLHIGRPAAAGHAHFVVESGATVEVGAGCHLGGASVYALAKGAKITIGHQTVFAGVVYVTAHEAANVAIGANCLFADACSITSSDVHKIFDRRTSRRLNPAGDIIIGDRVWFGSRAVILRNATLGNDSVVGWGSVVKGRFPPNVVVAGVPAKVIRRNIRWEH